MYYIQLLTNLWTNKTRIYYYELVMFFILPNFNTFIFNFCQPAKKLAICDSCDTKMGVADISNQEVLQYFIHKIL